MNLRLEQLAKWASLIALIVLIGASTFNINTVQGENKMNWNPANWNVVNELQGQNKPVSGFSAQASSGGGGGGGGGGGVTMPTTSTNYNPGNQQVVDNGGGWVNTGGGGDTGYYVNGTNYGSAAGYQSAMEAQAKQRARDAFNQGRNVYTDSINQRVGNESQGYQRSVQDWATGVTQKQQGIDTAGINADMAKTQGMRGIMDMVGNGIQSAGVMLGNRNAGSSSAAGAIANAYGKLGSKQASSVGNQYAQAQNQIGLEQSNLEAAKALQISRFGEDKVNIVNNIINDAQKQIAALNEAAAGASISDRMDIEAEKTRLRDAANAQLKAYDSEMSKAKGAQTDDQRRNEAQRLLALGTAPTTQFNYSTEAPAQFQNTGPFASSMPLYTYNRNKNEA